MARTWGELLGDGRPDAESEEQRSGLFSRLRDSLGRSRRALTEELAAAFSQVIPVLGRLEEALIAGDVGVPDCGGRSPTRGARWRRRRPEQSARRRVAELFGEPPRIDLAAAERRARRRRQRHRQDDAVGKLAYRLGEHGHSVIVAAADTFRAPEGSSASGPARGAEFVEGERGDPRGA